MIDPIELGRKAAALRKKVPIQRGRAGRNVRGDQIGKQLHAAGRPKMNTPGVFGYPRGKPV